MEIFKQSSIMKSSKNIRINSRGNIKTTTRDRVAASKSIIAIDKTTATNKKIIEVTITMETIKKVKLIEVANINMINHMESSSKT